MQKGHMLMLKNSPQSTEEIHFLTLKKILIGNPQAAHLICPLSHQCASETCAHACAYSSNDRWLSVKHTVFPMQ